MSDPTAAAITAAATRQAVATLAAAIIQVRGTASPEAIQDAYRDAYNSLYPAPNDPAYRTWARHAGLVAGAP